jgi:hypothetical protein
MVNLIKIIAKKTLVPTLILSALQLSACNSFFNDDISGKNDTIQVIVRINNYLPIGWGTKYNCRMIKSIKGQLTDIDSTFIMSASVGGESKFKDIHQLKIGSRYFIEFVKSDRISSTPYIPAGTTGLMDKKNFIWDITALKTAD